MFLGRQSMKDGGSDEQGENRSFIAKAMAQCARKEDFKRNARIIEDPGCLAYMCGVVARQNERRKMTGTSGALGVKHNRQNYYRVGIMYIFYLLKCF